MNVANLAVRRAMARTMNFDIRQTGRRIRERVRARDGERESLPVFRCFFFFFVFFASYGKFTRGDYIIERATIAEYDDTSIGRVKAVSRHY